MSLVSPRSAGLTMRAPPFAAEVLFLFFFFFFFFFFLRTSYIVTCTRCNNYTNIISYHNIHLYFSLGLYFPIHLLLPTYCIAILGSRRCLRTDLVLLAAMWYALPVPGYSLPGTTEYVCLFVLVFTLFCSFLNQGNPRVKGGKALGCILKGLWTLGVEKGSAVHRREELGSRTDTTYLRFVFLRTAVRLWWALPDSMIRTLRLYDSMLVCEYINMYDRERMGDVLLPM